MEESDPVNKLIESLVQRAHEEVDHRFTYHAPQLPGVVERMETLRAKIKDLAHEIVDLVPTCREQSRALTSLEDVLMQCNAGIARNQTPLKG